MNSNKCNIDGVKCTKEELLEATERAMISKNDVLKELELMKRENRATKENLENFIVDFYKMKMVKLSAMATKLHNTQKPTQELEPWF